MFGTTGHPQKQSINRLSAIMGPWFVSGSVHLGLVILSLFLFWQSLATMEQKSLSGSGEAGNRGVISHLVAHEAPMVYAPAGGSRDVSGGLGLVRIPPPTPEPEIFEGRTGHTIETSLQSLPDTAVVISCHFSPVAPLLPSFSTTRGFGHGISAACFFNVCSGPDQIGEKVLYLLDASGSLVDAMPVVIQELRQSLGRLSPKQQFQIIFFQNGKPLEVPVPAKGWKPATPQARDAASQWVDMAAGHIVARGITDPSAAIRLAMSQKPDTIFLLSDNITGRGRYEVHREDLFALFKQADSDGRTIVHAVQFLNPDPLNTLAEIARRNRGSFRAISAADLGLVREYTVQNAQAQ